MARGHALVVDDSSTARIILSRLLERAKLTTRGAASAEEGLELLKKEHFDIVFLDHLLPGMDGFQALEAIKRDPALRDTPVFMYTSQNAERYLRDAKARGAAGVIGKQVDRDQLLKIIETILADGTSTPDTDFPLPETGLDPAEHIQSRRLTGRLATLEIAYEETYDELRHLRKSMVQMEALHQENLNGMQRRMKHMVFFTLAGFAIVTLGLGLEIRDLSNVLGNVNNELMIIQEIVEDLVELVGAPPQ